MRSDSAPRASVTPQREATRPASSRAGLVWLAAAMALVLAVPALYRMAQGDRIYPGVHVAGVDLGGLNASEAVERLAEAGIDPRAPIRLEADDQNWTLSPDEAGLRMDANATVTAAWQLGRGNRPAALAEMLTARFSGRDLPVVVDFDENRAREALGGLADDFDREAVNAHIAMDGTQVVEAPAVVGRFINLPAALASLQGVARAGRWPIGPLRLDYSRVEPAVDEAGEALQTARALLSRPLTLRAEGEAWTLPPEALAPMLTTQPDGGQVRLDIDRQALAGWLAPVTEAISQSAQLPRFRFVADEGRLALLEGGRSGRQLGLDETAERILAAGRDGSHLVRLAIETQAPAVPDDADAADLGIQDVVGEATSRYAGSSAGRVHNVALATSRYDGLLIAPGETFSFNHHLGDVSEAEGYHKTLIILDGATADGVGGGVCQVSTTLFRSVFWAGLPVVERHAHGYRVAYYEQGAPPGFDATIYSPIVDLKFVNDTGSWLLIESSTNSPARTATFILWGTKPDRQVEMGDVVRGQPVAPPAPRVEVDPSLPTGASEVVELARDGLSVSLERIIIEGDQERRDVFHSTYRPTGQLTMVGPPPEGDAGEDQQGLGSTAQLP